MKEVGLSFVTRLDSVEGRRISDNPRSSMYATIILARFYLPSRPNSSYDLKKVSLRVTITNHQSYFLAVRKGWDLISLKLQSH